MSLLLSDEFKVLDKEKFEDCCAVGMKDKQICTVFQKSVEEMDKWCRENYGPNFTTTVYLVKQQAVSKYLMAMKEIGARGNTSAIGIMKELLLDMSEKKDEVLKVEFVNNVSREDNQNGVDGEKGDKK